MKLELLRFSDQNESTLGILFEDAGCCKQFLRYLGYESAIYNMFIIEENTNHIVVVYKQADSKTWKMYTGEFEDLRPEEYKWIK